MIPHMERTITMKKLILSAVAATFLAVLAAPVVSVATSTEAAAWPKHKKCTDWCTNRHGQKFRIRR
jgi:hypothetical protein